MPDSLPAAWPQSKSQYAPQLSAHSAGSQLTGDTGPIETIRKSVSTTAMAGKQILSRTAPLKSENAFDVRFICIREFHRGEIRWKLIQVEVATKVSETFGSPLNIAGPLLSFCNASEIIGAWRVKPQNSAGKYITIKSTVSSSSSSVSLRVVTVIRVLMPSTALLIVHTLPTDKIFPL